MSSAARSTILGQGRQAWRSLYELVDTFTSKVSPRQNSVNRFGPHQIITSFSTATPRLSKPPWSFPHVPRPCSNNVRRSFTSSGILLFGFASPFSTTSSVAATCSAAADSVVLGSAGQTSNIGRLAKQAWVRDIHTTTRRRVVRIHRRTKTSKSNTDNGNSAVAQQKTGSSSQPASNANAIPNTKPKVGPPEAESTSASVSKYFHLPAMPHLPHRPTKEEFLAAANGFWQRLKVRFKWFSIRSMRPWNIDEWGAFVSWFLFGHLVWILVGTTTFFSLGILFINTVFAQETLAKWVGDYLTESAGVTVVFESAIVPRWKDGVISFRNVFVSRRPGQVKSSVSKGSSSNAAAVAAAERGSDKETPDPVEVDDGNYTQFDITLNAVNVTLSFVKWWNGKGLLKDVEIKGVRGVVDRTSIKWSSEPADPLSYRHEHNPGDFEIDSFKLEDLLLTIHQPDGFRPFPVSIYSCELPQLRKQFLFYDFLAATHMSGSYDGSLFTIHPRQIHGVPAGREHMASDPLGEPDVWKKHSRIRIDGLKIDHLNRGVEGPFGWIYEGNVDIVADIRFPADDDDGITKVMADFYERLEEAVTSNRYIHILDLDKSRRYEKTISNDPSDFQSNETPTEIDTDSTTAEHALNSSPTQAASTSPPTPNTSTSDEDPPRYLVMDVRIHLNDVKATVPVFTSNLSYVNQALVRPIVAYINAKRTYIPINCRIVKRVSDFDGAWTIYECGLMDDASAEMYTAFARDVEDQQSRVRRLKKVGFWTLSLAVHALFMGMAGNVI
ncbi:mitochondrial distribution and morphology proteins-domain-containing protein [Daldinia caldariorum]|uniref:mitochondrial distribution and morphology proteins-domain-containing protein n=1 Tax=Daldinia caldariorum TaxID=326644 RepID=UPI0020082569|nr:mitochondrial distribution and morphology proteins-domain-containing protein [Daldinia caldariorum]KAI1470117.1 mitochondrial distribution and morphology proteins-domain-containing protein [Daldinia caldariorum]